MNERLTTLVGVLAALLLVVGIFLQPGTKAPISRPTSIEPGPNGLLALARWLDSEGVSVISARERYPTLTALTPSGNLLITAAPHERPIRADEVQSLKTWIAAGNTLLVLAALDDTPDWSMTPDTSRFLLDLEALTGVRFEAVPADTDEDEPRLLGEPGTQSSIELQANGSAHSLLTSVVRIRSHSDSTASLWQPAADSPHPGTVLLKESSTGMAAAWTRPFGRGHIITVAVSSLFSNRVLGEVDNRVLFSNIVRWHLSTGANVVFDDLHQGLSTLYDPEAFYSDSRVGITLLFLLAFWFIYMIGTQNRLLPIRPSDPVPQQGDFVRAMGGFLARQLRPDAAARMMIARWSEELASRGISATGPSLWNRLAENPLLDQDRLRALEDMEQRAKAGEKVDLGQLHNGIQRIREALG
jgi:hypothetical protein